MKNYLNQSFLWMIAAMIFAGVISSCNDNDVDDIQQADKTVLLDSINVAKNLLENTEEGTAEGQYQQGSKASLENAIEAAESVHSNSNVTQNQVNNAVIALGQAMQEYRSKVVLPVAFEDLVAYWKFDEGSGNVINDESSNGLTGALTAGHSSLGGSVPQWTEDRKGDAGKALHFSGGSHVLVPFNRVLNPEEITITMWVKADEIWPANYLVSQNAWNGYKLNLQEANKIFGTVKVSHNGETPIHDRDNEEPRLEEDQWYHIAFTFKNGEMAFFIEGTEAKRWTNTPGTMVRIEEPMDFVIGQETPNVDVDPNMTWELGHFRGSMDEIRIYKKALTGTQIETIYNQEKP